MVLNSLIDFCFDGGEIKYIIVNNYGARWVKNIKDNVICLNKHQIKDAVAYLLFNCYFTVGPKIFCQIINIRMGSDLAPFFANLFLYFYESKWMNELKKNDLIEPEKLCNIFRFIDDLNSINDGGEFESSYSNIYPEELQLGKGNTDKPEASCYRYTADKTVMPVFCKYMKNIMGNKKNIEKKLKKINDFVD